MTPEQLQLNRKSASNVVRYNLGLDQIQPSDWTYEQRTNYNKALASYIASYPSSFAESDLITAKEVQNTDYAMLQDSGFSFPDFISASVDNAIAINEDINPFSEKNRKFLLISLAAGLAVYFIGPVIIRAFRETTKTATT